MTASAVVFAYHDVGARCLPVVLAHGLRVPLVVTHRDDPAERPWFASVADLARDRGLEVATPNAPGMVQARIEALAPDFIFSFYYRRMLPPALLAAARRGAFNMHGSLLPRYRGRAPVNWAILNGERETGATLHRMADKPDAGPIVDRMPVPILPEDQALDVMRKVTVAAEVVLDRSLPKLLDGTATLEPQDLSRGSYFGGRRAEDGRIDWAQPAARIHDLVRAVAPPYPGAFTRLRGLTLQVNRTRLAGAPSPAGRGAELFEDAQGLLARCADGAPLRLLDWTVDGERPPVRDLLQRLGGTPVALGAAA
jgi:methionyl-tRNA formyltransferase